MPCLSSSDEPTPAGSTTPAIFFWGVMGAARRIWRDAPDMVRVAMCHVCHGLVGK
jgi:hypothetical protein